MAIFAFAAAGFGALASAKDRHYGQVFGTRPVPAGLRLALHAAGWSLLIISGGLSVMAWRWGFGLTIWLGILTAAALAVSLGLAFAPARLRGQKPARRT